MGRRANWLIGGVAVLGLAPWLPGWLTAAGLDVWNVTDLRRKVAENHRVEAGLTSEITHVQQQVRVKEVLADELIAGRLSLAEATDRFELMVTDSPRILTGLRTMYPDIPTDRERVARHVVDYTRSRVNDPRERERVAVRMTTELEALFPAPRSPDPMG